MMYLLLINNRLRAMSAFLNLLYFAIFKVYNQFGSNNRCYYLLMAAHGRSKWESLEHFSHYKVKDTKYTYAEK